MIRGCWEKYVLRIDSTYFIVMLGEENTHRTSIPIQFTEGTTVPRISKLYMANYISSDYPTYPAPVSHHHAEPPDQPDYISHLALLSPVHNAAPS